MRKSNISIVFILFLCLVIVFSGCAPTTTATTTEGAAEATTAAPVEGSGLKGELVYWSMWNETEPQAMVLKDAIADFMTLNPDVKVTTQWNGREIRKTLKPALDAGQQIDIWDEDTERIVKNYQTYALKLDDYYGKTYPTTEGKTLNDVMMGSLVDLTKTFSTDGGIYSVPYQPMMIAFMYNKDHFEKAGIAATPKTWDEFLVVCEKLKTAGFTPMTMDDAYIDLQLGYHLARLKGLPWVEQLVEDKTGAMWDDPAVMTALKDMQHLATQGFVSKNVAGNKWPAGQQEVANGEVTMYLNGTWLPNEISASTGPDFKWGQFAYPALTGGVDGTEAGIYGAQGFQVNSKCAAPDAAVALIVHLTTGKWDQELSAKTLGAPSSTDVEWPVQIQDEKVLFSSMKTWYSWSCGLAKNTDLFPVITSEFTKVFAGLSTPEDFIKTVKSSVK